MAIAAIIEAFAPTGEVVAALSASLGGWKPMTLYSVRRHSGTSLSGSPPSEPRRSSNRATRLSISSRVHMRTCRQSCMIPPVGIGFVSFYARGHGCVKTPGRTPGRRMQVFKRTWLSVAAKLAMVCVVAAGGWLPRAQAQEPIKVGMAIAQTGALAGGGKAALLALRMWVEDVNARGGMLGRKVELIAYDDQSSAATTPGIYAKLLDIDKVDLLIAPYGTVPTAPIMPLIKQRNLLLIGNFTFQVNHKVQHDMYFNNAPWNTAASWSDGFFKLGKAVGAKTVAFLNADQEFAQSLAEGAKEFAAKL